VFSDPYIEALLVDEEMADLVWAAWHRNEISEDDPCLAWTLISLRDINT
jgi:hypothetical protein